MILKIHLEYVRIFVSQHILYICPYVEKDKLGRGGGGGRGQGTDTFEKVSSLEYISPKISLAKP